MPRQIREHRDDSVWREVLVPNFSLGMDLSESPELIDPQSVQSIINYSLVDGEVRGDFGYGSLGGTLRGTPKGIHVHETRAGVKTQVCVTDDTFYIYVPAVDEWHYVSDGVSTTLDANASGGAAALSVADETGFTGGDFVGLLLDDGTQHQTTVASTSPGTVNIDDALPGSGVVASIGNTLVKALDLNGDDDNQVVFAGLASHEWLVFTNGVDKPYRYDGSTVEVVPNLPSGGDTICRTLTVFGEGGYLILGNLIQSGTEEPYKYVWCDPGDPTTWGANSFNRLLDIRDSIKAMRPLGPDLMVYRSRSFVRLELDPDADIVGGESPFNVRSILYGESVSAQGVGVLSPNAVFGATDEHILMSFDGIYRYRGGLVPELISKPIDKAVFGKEGKLDKTNAHRAFVFLADETNEVFCLYPTSDDTFCSQAAVYDRDRRTWRERSYTHELTCAGRREGGETIRIIDLTGTIAEQVWKIGTGPVAGLSPSVLLGDSDNDLVRVVDYVASTDGGTSFVCSLSTKRFKAPGRQLRFDSVEIEYSGPPIAVQMRKNDDEFESLGILPVSTKLVRTRLHKQRVVDSFNILLFQAGSGGYIGTMKVVYREEAKWGL